MQETVKNLNIDDIIPNRFQPREVFEDQALRELAQSIKEHGVIQPIIVRPVGNKFEIIAGERRYKASTMIGNTTIPAIVRDLSDIESSKQALLENIQRKDLNAIEEARTYQTILRLDNITQKELADTIGKSQSSVSNKLRLLTLPEEVQEAVLNVEISERHARSLLKILNRDLQLEYLRKIKEERIPVRILEKMIKSDERIKEGNNMDLNKENEELNNREINQEIPNQEVVNNINNQTQNALNQGQAIPNVEENMNLTSNTPDLNQRENTLNNEVDEESKESPNQVKVEEEKVPSIFSPEKDPRFKKEEINTNIKQTATGDEIIGQGLLAGKPVEAKEEEKQVVGKINPIKVPASEAINNEVTLDSEQDVPKMPVPTKASTEEEKVELPTINETEVKEEKEEKKEEDVETLEVEESQYDNTYNEKPLNTVNQTTNNQKVLLSQAGGQILPTNVEPGDQTIVGDEPNERVKELIRSPELKMALIGINKVVKNLERRGLEVEEIHKTYSDHLELVLKIKK